VLCARAPCEVIK